MQSSDGIDLIEKFFNCWEEYRKANYENELRIAIFRLGESVSSLSNWVEDYGKDHLVEALLDEDLAAAEQDAEKLDILLEELCEMTEDVFLNHIWPASVDNKIHEIQALMDKNSAKYSDV